MTFLQEAGFNAVLAQVRPTGDALYASNMAPWSKYLTGKQGRAPEDGFDPMAFMIDEAHARNLEFHAWLNPYRAATDTLVDSFSKNHPYQTHPDWFVQYGGKLYFNPAIPEVRNHITEIVMEVVMKYDVDGIHFDDYFYPYPASGELFPDAEDFSKYGFGFFSIDEWRRDNVNKLISQISEMLKSIAPHVKFGVSPFGVWRNAAEDPTLGSPTRAGVTTYDDLFADVRYWLEKGWIDYVAPQLYWHIGFPPADFEVLMEWWENNSFDHHVYIGHAAYKVGQHPDDAWKNPNEIPKQVAFTRMLPKIKGSIYYNTGSLKKNLTGMTDSLKNHYYAAPAIWPEFEKKQIPVPAPPSLSKPTAKKGVLKIKCNLPAEEENAHYLVVYRFEDRLPGDYSNPKNIWKIIRLEGATSLTIEDDTIQKGKSYVYAAAAVNRVHNESILSNWRGVEVGNKRVKRLK